MPTLNALTPRDSGSQLGGQLGSWGTQPQIASFLFSTTPFPHPRARAFFSATSGDYVQQPWGFPEGVFREEMVDTSPGLLT